MTIVKQVLSDEVQFAPIGLLDMYNSGGAVEAFDSAIDVSECFINIKARGCGRFGAYSSLSPKRCTVDRREKEFLYCAEKQKNKDIFRLSKIYFRF